MKQPGLTARERRFIAEYLETGNPETAAVRAGFTPKRAAATGIRLLNKREVQQALQRSWRSQPKLRPVTERDILGELSAIAFSDFTQFVRVEDGAVVVTDSRALDYSQRAAIAGIKDTGKGVEIKLHDKQKALELLAKYLGLFDREDSRDSAVRVELEGVPEEWTL